MVAYTDAPCEPLEVAELVWIPKFNEEIFFSWRWSTLLKCLPALPCRPPIPFTTINRVIDRGFDVRFGKLGVARRIGRKGAFPGSRRLVQRSLLLPQNRLQG